jgi:hypothetical protein
LSVSFFLSLCVGIEGKKLQMEKLRQELAAISDKIQALPLEVNSLKKVEQEKQKTYEAQLKGGFLCGFVRVFVA